MFATISWITWTFCWLPTQEAAEPSWQPPKDVAYRVETIISEGTRMAAEIYTPRDESNAKLPVIVMSHGWGAQLGRSVLTQSPSRGPGTS